MTSQLTHPNTITLYDYGRTPEGIFYYAMEYLDGLTLDRLVKQYGAQPEGRVISILRQVCGSLAEAHAIGLVHRDIKPANVFLTQRGGVPDFVKVLDFGLVKARDAQGGVELTMAEATLGTPLYMSPEAVEHPNEVDARSDLYSLGAVGYFLVTGQALFDCLTLGEVLMHQVKDLPVRPSERLGKPVSPDLEELLMRCLAKNPASRPANARELDDALARCRNAADWTRELADEWWRKFAAAQSEKTMVTTIPASGKMTRPVFENSSVSETLKSWLWALVLAAFALPARADVLIATNGERFVGTVIEETTNTVVFQSDLGGRLTLYPSEIRKLERTVPGETNAPPTHRSPFPPTSLPRRHPPTCRGCRPASATTVPTGSSSSRANGCGASSNTSRTRRWSLTATNSMNRR